MTPNLLSLIALVIIGVGLAMIYLPLGIVYAGLMLFLLANEMNKMKGKDNEST